MYLVDHPTEAATTSNIIENFTYIEDQLNKSLYSHRKTIKRLAVPTITSATNAPVSAATSAAPTTALTTSTVFTPASTIEPAATSASTTAFSFTQQHQSSDGNSFQTTAINPRNSFEIPSTLTTQYVTQPIYASSVSTASSTDSIISNVQPDFPVTKDQIGKY